MSSSEISEWIAFERLEPFGFSIDSWRFARVCSTIAAYTPMGHKSKPPSFSDFMNEYDTTKRLMQHADGDELGIRDDEEFLASMFAVDETKLSSISKHGGISVFEGEAGPVKRIGKRALKPGSKRRKKIDAILKEFE